MKTEKWLEKTFNVLVILLLGAGLLFGNTLYAQANGTSPTSSHEQYDDLTQMVIRLVHETIPESQNREILLSDIEADGNWVFGLVVLRANEEFISPTLLLFVAQQNMGKWEVALESTKKFVDVLPQVPTSLISNQAKSYLSASPQPAGSGVAQLSLPWATGETWTLSGGTHNYAGLDARPWSALDFTKSGGGIARAARDGVVWRSSACPNYIRVDHPDGWQTGYYHLANERVYNGQSVARGQALGDISALAGCGGSATGAHVHFTLLLNGTHQDFNNVDLGGWTVQDGTTQYTGCMVRISDGVRVCQWGNIYNDGTIGSGDPPADVVIVNPPTLTPAYSGDMCGSAWHRITGYGGQYAYLTLNTNVASQSTNSATWQPNLPVAGTYKIEAYIPNHSVIYWQCPTKTITSDTSDARYTIYHANGTNTVSKNQAPLANSWLYLGTFTCDSGASCKVKLSDLNGEAALTRTISFSAVRYTLIQEADTTPPSVLSIRRANANPTSAAQVDFTVTFSESVTNVDIFDFTLTTSGVSGAYVVSVSGSANIYTVSVNTGTGNGTIQLNLSDNDSIKDAAGNPLGGVGAGNGSFTSGEVYDVQKDASAPTVVSSTRLGSNPTNLATVQYKVTFSESVTGVDTADFVLSSTAGISGASILSVAGSGNTYTVTVDTGFGNGDIRLDIRSGASIQDLSGNNLSGGFTTGESYTVIKIMIPLTDFDGDGTIEKAVFRPSNSTWYVYGVGRFTYGQAGDIPVAADYNGDGKGEVAVFRPSNSTWYIYGIGPFVYGQTGDIPVPADYNGDGKADIAIFRPSNSTWYIYGSGSFAYGQDGDIPVPADYNGDGKTEIAVFRPSNSTWYIYGVGPFLYGQIGDIPVVADYNGDGKADIAVFRPSNSTWYIYGVGSFTYGQDGDIPVPADYNGDGKTEIAVFRPSNSTWYIYTVGSFVYGDVGDIPVRPDIWR